MKDEITVNDDDALDGVEGLSDDALDKLIGDMPKTEDDDEWDAHDVNLEGDDEGEEDDSDDDEGDDEDGEDKDDDAEESEEGDPAEGDEADADNEGAAEEEDDDSETIDSLSARLELMEAENDAMTAALERERLLSDRNAGKLGALMQKIDAGQNRKAPAGDDEFEDDGQPAKATDKDTAGDKALNEIRTEKVERAINHAAQDFYRENIEFFTELEKAAGTDANQEFQADLIRRVAEANAELGDDIKQMSPKMASKVAKAVIRGAFADKRVELLRDFNKQAAKAEKKSTEGVRARKKGAAGARTKKTAKTRGSTKPKALSQMTDAELDVEFKKAQQAEED